MKNLRKKLYPYIVGCIVFTVLCLFILSAYSSEPWDEPFLPKDSDWWMTFTFTNLQHNAFESSKSNDVEIVIATGASGLMLFKSWVIRRKGIKPYHLASSSHLTYQGIEIRLESNAAIQYLCNIKGIDATEVVKNQDQGHYYLAFCKVSDDKIKALGFKAILPDDIHNIPDRGKAIDSNGQPFCLSVTNSLGKHNGNVNISLVHSLDTNILACISSIRTGMTVNETENIVESYGIIPPPVFFAALNRVELDCQTSDTNIILRLYFNYGPSENELTKYELLEIKGRETKVILSKPDGFNP
jgi:hypothetical protein